MYVLINSDRKRIKYLDGKLIPANKNPDVLFKIAEDHNMLYYEVLKVG